MNWAHSGQLILSEREPMEVSYTKPLIASGYCICMISSSSISRRLTVSASLHQHFFPVKSAPKSDSLFNLSWKDDKQLCPPRWPTFSPSLSSLIIIIILNIVIISLSPSHSCSIYSANKVFVTNCPSLHSSLRAFLSGAAPPSASFVSTRSSNDKKLARERAEKETVVDSFR